MISATAIYAGANIAGCVALGLLGLYFLALLLGLARYAITRSVSRAAAIRAKQLAHDLTRKAATGRKICMDLEQSDDRSEAAIVARRWGQRTRSEAVDSEVLRRAEDSPFLATTLREVMNGDRRDAAAIQGAAEKAIGGWSRGWAHRFAVIMFAAPPAGAAPTMSGAASALAAFAQTKGDPTALLVGMGVALGTTYIGAMISVAAALAALAASQVVQGESRRLASSVQTVVSADNRLRATHADVIARLTRDTPRRELKHA